MSWSFEDTSRTNSVFHTLVLMFVTYENTNRDTLHTKVSRIYFRYINEIVIRKSFLEKRSCVESTLQLNFEENQEVGFNCTFKLNTELFFLIEQPHVQYHSAPHRRQSQNFLDRVHLPVPKKRISPPSETLRVGHQSPIQNLTFCFQKSLHRGAPKRDHFVCRHSQLHHDDHQVGGFWYFGRFEPLVQSIWRHF